MKLIFSVCVTFLVFALQVESHYKKKYWKKYRYNPTNTNKNNEDPPSIIDASNPFAQVLVNPYNKPLTKSERKAVESATPRVDWIPTGTEAQPSNAGRSNVIRPTITGGTRAQQGYFPWQASLLLDNVALCGGSLISDSYILTAAHCTATYSIIDCTLGGIDRNTAENLEFYAALKAKYVHPGYNRSTLINDISILQTTNKVNFNNFVGTVRLPRKNHTSLTFDGFDAVASGYGRTAPSSTTSIFLNYAWLKVTTNTKCAEYYSTKYVHASTLCTDCTNGRSICGGDSGGPLAMQEPDGFYTIIGVVSFASSAGCNTGPCGFSRVTSYEGWISQTTGLAFR